MVVGVTPDATTSPSLASTTEADDFAAAWEAFGVATRRARDRLSREDGIGLTPSQLHLLEPLAEGERLTVGRTAEAAGVSAPTATRMLDGLERGGVVVRSADGEDRRCVNVRLTASGRELVRRKRAAVAGRRAGLFARLGAVEAEEATRLLRRLAELVDEL
jgi:DNA-binding MarR family transcriptional regulator